MRVVLVDDEQNIRETVRALLNIYAPDVEIVAEANGVKAGILTIKEHKPDLVLLDVEMKDGTGFDLLSLYGIVDFQVIFITGHDAFAIKAFKFSALDYVLKPVDPDDLIKALEKARDNHSSIENDLKIKSLMQNQKDEPQRQKIILKDSKSIFVIEIKDIIRCQSENNYTKFFIQDGREILVSNTLKEYENLFTGHPFFRAHQSHLINMIHLDRFDKRDGGYVVMKNGDDIPVAVRKKESLLEAINKL